MRSHHVLPTVVVGGYAAVASLAFAATLIETTLLYPNIFRDVPASLALSEEFMSEVAIGDVMRPLGAALLFTALLALAAAVRYRLARRWVLLSLLPLLIGQAVLSMLYQWPRATMLFDDRARYTTAEIQRAADEFLLGHYARIGAAFLTAALAVTALLVCHRALVRTAARREALPAG
ncbi:hypothetical protein [Nocardia harenae]|uniref:hypothetical protein n=1 Tax=Nocardia harenae TaxID=358707 RepID=UPI00082DEB82|nr:hypothetical protein [Nocardia harenae]